MSVNPKIIPCLVSICIMLCAPATDGLNGALKKSRALPAKKRQAAAGIPRDRVLTDFKSAYQSPPDSKTLRLTHTGKIRTGFEMVGGRKTPAQVHQVALTVQLTECGIRMRDIWEVYYYRLETDWIFRDIVQAASAQLTKTKKKHPPLNDDEAGNLISAALQQRHPGIQVNTVTIIRKKQTWRLCIPEYQIQARSTVMMTNDAYNTSSSAECLFAVTIAHHSAFEVTKINCLYKGKERADCHPGTMCRELSSKTTIPAISDIDATALLRAAFANEYGLKKNNIEIEEFAIIKRLPEINFGKKIPCMVRTRFVINTFMNAPGASDAPRRIEKNRSVFECTVYAALEYSTANNGWTGLIESCCSSDELRCDWPCSDPRRGCKSIGEK